jgi:hypothetical protein
VGSPSTAYSALARAAMRVTCARPAMMTSFPHPAGCAPALPSRAPQPAIEPAAWDASMQDANELLAVCPLAL